MKQYDERDLEITNYSEFNGAKFTAELVKFFKKNQGSEFTAEEVSRSINMIQFEHFYTDDIRFMCKTLAEMDILVHVGNGFFATYEAWKWKV